MVRAFAMLPNGRGERGIWQEGRGESGVLPGEVASAGKRCFAAASEIVI